MQKWIHNDTYTSNSNQNASRKNACTIWMTSTHKVIVAKIILKVMIAIKTTPIINDDDNQCNHY